MGSCLSRDDNALQHTSPRSTETTALNNLQRNSENNDQIDLGKNTIWSADYPITMSELIKKREIFWETAPAYGGHQEIWQALRQIIESDDYQLSIAILESANILVPSKKIVNGCFDELGYKYIIPDYCLSSPGNLINEQPVTNTSLNDSHNQNPLHFQSPSENADELPIDQLASNNNLSINFAADKTEEYTSSPKIKSNSLNNSMPSTSANDNTSLELSLLNSSITSNTSKDPESLKPFKIIIRTSSGSDIPIHITTSDTTESLKLKIYNHLSLEESNTRVILLLKGKILSQSSNLLNDLKIADGSIVQAMISSI
ncbi:Ubiquitin domain-containing protein 1 [Smittium culicis]|uniref:Ubiquitin domain-containing protein 1 n=1 Tax=Smittium culicis TaxID=133412 RepID=A0A1R1Y6I7_9FUNG|nr:Ubiquitin domain-containing protein 1 [Smittium culicis]